MIDALLIPALAVLNRVRGGGFWADRLPGHPRFYVAPAIAVLCLPVMPWLKAVEAGACYLVWSFLPWGHLMCLGKFIPPRPMSPIESSCLEVVKGDYLVALMLLHLIGLLPMAFLVSPLAFLAPIPIGLSYALGWSVTPATAIRTAEILVGAVWGVLLLVRY